jgi:hypothetical protein
MSLSREIIDPVQNRARAKDQNQPSRPDRVAAENSDNSVEVILTPQQTLPIHDWRRSEDRRGWDWRLDFEVDRLRTRSDRVL